MNRLVILASMWDNTLTIPTPLGGTCLPDLDACRDFANKHKYDGIWVRFGITKHETSIMIRKFRHQDQVLRASGLSRKEIAGVRVAQRLREIAKSS